jgi:triphosphoribosyl-dephospho-CoA synthetase
VKFQIQKIGFSMNKSASVQRSLSFKSAILDQTSLRSEMRRAFLLACCLEPIADKPGCTTRFIDSTPGTKLEYFTIAAINSIEPLLEILDRVVNFNGQPNVIFDLAYRAQLESNRNRLGGKVNYAQIFMLLPLLTAQALLFVEGKNTRDITLLTQRAFKCIANTSRDDVVQLQKFVDQSRLQSEAHNLRINIKRQQLFPVFSGCKNILEATTVVEFQHMRMVQEVANGYIQCLDIYEKYFEHSTLGLLRSSELAFNYLLPIVGRADVAADCIVVAMFFAIVNNPDKTLFL